MYDKTHRIKVNNHKNPSEHPVTIAHLLNRCTYPKIPMSRVTSTFWPRVIPCLTSLKFIFTSHQKIFIDPNNIYFGFKSPVAEWVYRQPATPERVPIVYEKELPFPNAIL